MTRLTDADRRLRAVTEADLQTLVTDLATALGWVWIHVRPGRTAHGWRTPVEGPLGAGWPDLVLLRVRDRRLLFVELKRETEHPTAEQAAVLAALGELMAPYPEIPSDFPDVEARSYLAGVVAGLHKALREAGKVEVHLWRPRDIADPIETSRAFEVLR